MRLLNFFSIPKEIDTLQELEIEKGRVQLMIMKIAAISLGFIMTSVVLMMLVGLFMPNNVIDNNEIFKIIGPAFSTIVGAFVGAFATMMGMKIYDFDPNVKSQEMGKTDYKSIAEADSLKISDDIRMLEAINKYRNSDEDLGPF
jgi:hypothetical protein|tara:strand:+ start:280 stop:711 length:432 start_codon:yes stop_codon:yes gene_type:complete